MKQVWRILFLLCAATALLTCTALAADDYTFSTWTSGDEVAISGITVDAAQPTDVVIPATIDGKTITGIDLQNSLDKEGAAKISSLRFSNDNLLIFGNLFRWKYESTASGELNYPLNYNGTKTWSAPDTETFLENIPDFVANSYNYDSNRDGTNDTWYVGSNLVRVDAGYTGDLTVKDGTVSVLAGAMEGCANLGRVTLPDSVEWIGVRAFANSGVTSVNIPRGLLTDGSKTIQMQTFYGCEKLTSVSFPKGSDCLDMVALLAFYECKSLTDFDFTRVNKIAYLSFAKAFAPGTAIDLSQTLATEGMAQFSHSGVGSVDFGSTPGKIVTDQMFYRCQSLTNVRDSGAITTLNPWAFEDCINLTNDVLKNSVVTFLPYRAFANTGMTEITIPASVTGTGGGTFAGNEQVETVNWYGSIGTTPLFALFNDCSITKYNWDSFNMPASIDTLDKEYTYPQTLNLYTEIPVCKEMPYLETVNVKYDITSIPNYALQFCPKLKTITFQSPEKITSIGPQAFMGCLSLKDFPFTKMVELESIGNRAFYLTDNNYQLVTPARYDALSDAEKAYGLTDIDLSKCSRLNIENTGSAAFYNQYSVQSLHLPAGYCTASVYNSLFHGTVSMKTLICDGDMYNNFIANNVFSGDSTSYHYNLETVTVKGQIVVPYSNPAFFHMTGLKTVNLPNATEIPQNTFMKCSALKTVYAPNITSVGDCAFFESGLESAVISKDVTYGSNVFYHCDSLKKVVVEEGVTELGDFMFEQCGALERVSLPSTLETINWAAFKDASPSVIDIPASVTEIEDDAFSSGAFKLIFRGSPVVDLTHSGFFNPDPSLNTLYPINDDATIYYTSQDAKNAADLYKASVGEGNAPDIQPALGVQPLVLSGAPTEVYVGSSLDLSNLTVTYDGDTLTPDQYTLDYNAADRTTGVRTVTLTVTDEALLDETELYSADISVIGSSGKAVSGPVYSTVDQSAMPYTEFPVQVKEVPKPSGGGSSALTVPVSGDSNTVKVTATISGKTATLKDIPEKEIQKVLGADVDTGIVEFDLTGLKKTVDTVKLPTATVEKIAAATEERGNDADGMCVQLPGAAITFDAAAVQEIAEQAAGSDIQIQVKQIGKNTLNAAQKQTVEEMETAVILDISVFSDGQKLCTEEADGFGGGIATVFYPYDIPDDSAPENYSVYYLNEQGVPEKLNAVYDAGKGGFAFTLPHLSVYLIAYEEKVEPVSPDSSTCPRDNTCPIDKYTDTETDVWWHDGIHYCLDKGLMNGFPGDLFKPNDDISRAQIVTVLWRQSGEPVVNYAMSFADVAADQWYTEAVRWAQSTEVVTGYSDDAFGPNDSITREQLATILYRYAGFVGVDTDKAMENTNTLSFDDSFSVSSWASEGVNWCVAAGILNGSNNQLKPRDNAARAEAATMLYRFCENVLK